MLYFAWVREQIGRGQETIDPPPEAATLDALLDWLAQLPLAAAEDPATDRPQPLATVGAPSSAASTPASGASGDVPAPAPASNHAAAALP